MRPLGLLLPIACVVSGLAWASYAAWRGGEGWRLAWRALLGGAAAFGIAVAGYDVAATLGARFEWERLLAARLPDAALLAAGIGLVEEGAKLAALILVVERGWRARAVVGAAFGVAAGFAALETFTTQRGLGAPVALARAALGPAAHAILALPLALGVAAAARRGAAAWPQVALGLVGSAALHALGDLSLATPGAGRLGYALALLAPTLALFALERRAALPRPSAPALGVARAAH
jgi:RsiW-degrading membrane proteinase PrsW (M82 family)